MNRLTAAVLSVLMAAAVGCKAPKMNFCHPSKGAVDAGDPYATPCAAQEICGSFSSGYQCCTPGRNPGCRPPLEGH